MKKSIPLILIILLYSGCNTLRIFNNNAGEIHNIPQEFYDSGEVISKNGVEEIEIKMVNGLPICLVEINGKEYRFLFDTGSLTVIPVEIFDALNLKVSYNPHYGDFNNRSQPTKHTVLPSLKINNLEFKNIGAVIIDIDETLNCFYDGIIGANLMAHMTWMFDYQNNKVYASENLSDLKTEDYDFTISFRTQNQKTPVIRGGVSVKILPMIFDTGFNGITQVPNDYDFYRRISSENMFVTRTGIQSVGFYGAGNYIKSFTMKTDLQIGNEIFPDELLKGGSKALIGNQFLKDYIFTIDWGSNKIYFKRNLNVKPKSLMSFGFGNIFIDNKLQVVQIIEEANSPLKLGDEILTINGYVYTDICEYMLKNRETTLNEIDVIVKRKRDTLNYSIPKRTYIK